MTRLPNPHSLQNNMMIIMMMRRILIRMMMRRTRTRTRMRTSMMMRMRMRMRMRRIKHSYHTPLGFQSLHSGMSCPKNLCNLRMPSDERFWKLSPNDMSNEEASALTQRQPPTTDPGEGLGRTRAQGLAKLLSTWNSAQHRVEIVPCEVIPVTTNRIYSNY